MKNKFNIENQIELARVEERISKQRAIMLWSGDFFEKMTAGSFKTLAEIHKNLFEEIYWFAGKLRNENISKGNGRSMRLWLDHILKTELKKVADWSRIDKNIYLRAMDRSPIDDAEIKKVLFGALTEKINDREIFMKSLDASYFYENYFATGVRIYEDYVNKRRDG